MTQKVFTLFIETIDSIGCISSEIYDSIEVIFPKANFEVTSGKEGCQLNDAFFNASNSVNISRNNDR